MRLEPTNSAPGRSTVAGPLGRAWLSVFALAAVTAIAGCGDGCGGSGSGVQPVAPATAPLAQTAPPPPPPEAPAEPAAEPTPPPVDPNLKPGWSKLVLDEQVPICVFPGFAAHDEPKFLKDVKKQTLRADNPIVIGAFGPWCINEGCDDLPSLQCVAKRSGDTINVRTHYWGYRKDGSNCKGGVCRQVTAGCETPKLEAGTYTIQHGQESYKLKIPSTLRNPCFGKELTPPGQ
jgi:hypothetical protein